MSALYLHIPFCKQACHYCNFHFSTSLQYKSEMVAALMREIEMRKDYLPGKKLNSVYFGGGTPSLLSERDLSLIFDETDKHFVFNDEAEITLEANPDDLTFEKLRILRDSPTNRLSIGIQSFSDEDLCYMNRAHNAKEAAGCIERAQKYGFENLTVDLIYGTPTMSDAQWQENVERIIDLGIPHVSCYALTVEPQTALQHFIEKGKSQPVDEEQTARQFEYLTARLKAAGFVHYEISNFAKPGSFAKHNSNYWTGSPYLGIGPSAHSFDGKSRQWNAANNAAYMKGIEAGKVPFEREFLTAAQRYNEYILTALRTVWGVDLQKIEPNFAAYFLKNVQPFLKNETVFEKQGVFCLTEKGKLLADNISMELFAED